MEKWIIRNINTIVQVSCKLRHSSKVGLQTNWYLVVRFRILTAGASFDLSQGSWASSIRGKKIVYQVVVGRESGTVKVWFTRRTWLMARGFDINEIHKIFLLHICAIKNASYYFQKYLFLRFATFSKTFTLVKYF